MNSDWQNFLMQHQAHIQDGVVQHFDNPDAELDASENGTVLCDLSQFGTLHVSGDDAQSFLQNLLSNDIRNVARGRRLFVATAYHYPRSDAQEALPVCAAR